MIEHYPDDTDVFEVISEKTTYGNVRDFYKKRGIIYISNKRSEIASYSSRLFLGSNDYEEMKKNTAIKKNFKKISGIELKTSNELDAIGIILANKRGECIDEKSDLILTEVITQPDGIIKCKAEYTSKNIGTVDLLKEDRNSCEFQIEKKDQRKIVLTHHEKNEDYSKIIEILESVSTDLEEDEKIIPQIIKLENLTISERIEFFDRLLAFDYDNFRLENVISIKIRKGEEQESDEIPEVELKDIKEALLRGDNLRTNEFVKKFERNGYYFSGITVKLAHKTEPNKIHLEIFFKANPELPEINIKKTFELIDDVEQKKILPPDIQEQYLREFWGVFTKTYFEFVSDTSP